MASSVTMTITAELDADAERLWELWSDPHQLERWWGPPSHPSTFAVDENGKRRYDVRVAAPITQLLPL